MGFRRGEHLAVAVGDEILNLCSDGHPRPALLGSACGRYDAVGAALVAAVDYVHPRAHGRVALRLRHVLHDVRRLRRDDLVALEDALEQILETVGVLRPHDEIDLGDATEERLAFLLSHAPRHDDRHVLAFVLPLGVRAEV